MKKFYVYKITNTINNKIYIGRTSGSKKRRWRDHINLALRKGYLADKIKYKQYPIHRAIAKYGLENFKFEYIGEYETKIDVIKAEEEFIKQYNSTDRKFGYNVLTKDSDIGEVKKSLKNEQIINLFEEYIKDGQNKNTISKKFNICRDSVSKIISRESYVDAYVPDHLIKKAQDKCRMADHSKKTNPQLIEEIKCMSINGFDNRDISNKTGLSLPYIRKILKTDRILKPKKQIQKIILTKELAENIINDYINGLSVSSLNKKYNLTSDITRGILLEKTRTIKNFNIDSNLFEKVKQRSIKNSKVKLNEIDIINIFKDFANGHTKEEISKKLNIKESNVVFILTRKTWKTIEIPTDILNIVNKKLKLNPISGKFKMRTKSEKIKLKNELINDLVNNNLSIHEICKKFKLRKEFVLKIIRGANWINIEISNELNEKLKQYNFKRKLKK